MKAPTLIERLAVASEFLKKRLPKEGLPTTAAVLGSGFKVVAERLSVELEIPLSEVPHMPVPSVDGHGNSLLIGTLGQQRVALFTGRVHMYEGFSAMETAFAVRVAARLGLKNLVLTNAAGGLNAKVTPGDIVVLQDHINFTGSNCLVGEARLLGKQFVDMNACYHPTWSATIRKSNGLKSGVYMGLLGPTYETPAETKLFAQMGADMVGMSTVQEVIAARQLGLNVAALSFVTNMACGISASVDHQEVLDAAQTHKHKLDTVLTHALGCAPSTL